MRKTKILIAGLFFALMLNLALAQQVFLATEQNYADLSVASVAANKVGATIFFIPSNTIPTEIMQQIANLSPEAVYIIGGPAVISEAVEQQLGQRLANYTLVRVWGMTRYGTSAEVAKYFWPEGSEKAVIVADLPDEVPSNLDYATIVSKAAEIASNEQIPLLLNPSDKLSSDVLEALQTLNVTEITLVGNFSPTVQEALANANITIKEIITGAPKEIEDIIEQRVEQANVSFARPLVIAAVGGWQDMLFARASPRGVSLLVRNASEIPETVSRVSNLIATGNFTKILIVGVPDLAIQIYNALIDAGLQNRIEIVLVSGRKYERIVTIAKHMKKIAEEIREKYEERRHRIQQKLQAMLTKIGERCDYWHDYANSIYNSILANLTNASGFSLIIEQTYDACKQAVNKSQPMKARIALEAIKHYAKLLVWKYRHLGVAKEEFKHELEEEIKSPKEMRKKMLKIQQKTLEKLEEIKERKEECRELGLELKKAIVEGNFKEARELKAKIASKCKILVSSRPVVPPIKARKIAGRITR